MADKGKACDGALLLLKARLGNLFCDFVGGALLGVKQPGRVTAQCTAQPPQRDRQLVCGRIHPVEEVEAVVGNALKERAACRARHHLRAVERHGSCRNQRLAPVQVHQVAGEGLVTGKVLERKAGVGRIKVEHQRAARIVAVRRKGDVAHLHRLKPLLLQPAE